MKVKSTEKELARPVVSALRSDGWEVWQEIQLERGGPIADIVVVRNRIVWIIEVKSTLSMALIEQAYKWRMWVHFVSVATPWNREVKGRWMAHQVLREFGIGLLKISLNSYEPDRSYVSEDIQPKFNRNTGHIYIERLRNLDPAMQDFCESGSKSDQRWTPFADTVAKLQAYVWKNPHCKLQDAMRAISHHYASHNTAVSSMSKWIEFGHVKGINKVREGRSMYLDLVLEEIDADKLRKFKYLVD